MHAGRWSCSTHEIEFMIKWYSTVVRFSDAICYMLTHCLLCIVYWSPMWAFDSRTCKTNSQRILKTVLPHMRVAKSGYLMNISSTSGIRGAPCYEFYTGKPDFNNVQMLFLPEHCRHFSIFCTFFCIYPLLLMSHRYLTNCISSNSGSKFALEGITDSLRYSLAPFNIPITNINPGPVR